MFYRDNRLQFWLLWVLHVLYTRLLCYYTLS